MDAGGAAGIKRDSAIDFDRGAPGVPARLDGRDARLSTSQEPLESQPITNPIVPRDYQTHVDVHPYLDRIGYQGSLTPTAEVLRALHRAHMFTVPFENLDIGLGREIVCDEARFLHKIVNERRGGFCYELNGAFAALLCALGFQVTLLSARVPRADGSDGPEFDHLTLRVDLEEPWLADVGFGDSFVEPLRLEPRIEQKQFGRVYRLGSIEGGFRFESKAETGKAEGEVERDWKEEYLFKLKPRQLAEFAPMCRYHQTSPDSPFTRKRVCSRATPEGRITLSNGKLIETRNGIREEGLVGDRVGDKEWRERLLDLFGVVLP